MYENCKIVICDLDLTTFHQLPAKEASASTAPSTMSLNIPLKGMSPPWMGIGFSKFSSKHWDWLSHPFSDGDDVRGGSLSRYYGGHKGFNKVVWEVAERKDGENPSITFKYHSHNGEEGFLGDVLVRATYTFTSSTTMRLDMEAMPENKPLQLA
ncbi:hypothetical protein HHK36_014841 [Tetracentron sinense]|uniref:Uncharacterized protein n=1 Tax=Tetracentron sinense TaxID=13715 RepID=A0A834Z877_TETSI|nr:hypothetical protein HHK36_014841 [Tetracentron sinense]